MQSLFEDVPATPDPSNPNSPTKVDWYYNFTYQIDQINNGNKKVLPVPATDPNKPPPDPKQVAKKTLRDQYVRALKTMIDQNYNIFRAKYYGAKSGIDFAGDATTIMLTGAGTIANGARVKTILSAIATATAGLSGKASAEFWAGQSQAAIASRMDALRAQVWADMTKFMGDDYSYEQYPIESAFGDLNSYFYAGTPVAALEDIDRQSGQQKKTATDQQRDNQGLAPLSSNATENSGTTGKAKPANPPKP